MKIKTLIKLTTTVALTFGFVAANAAYPVGDVVNGAPVKLNINGGISANQAINCYLASKAINKVNQENAFYGCVYDMVKINHANKIATKNVEDKKLSLVDSIKQAQATNTSLTSKQYDDYARMANIMMFASAKSDESIEFKKALRDSAVDYAFNEALKSKKPFSYQVLKYTQNQATNQAILTTLLAMSDTLNQIKNDLSSSSCITGNCTVKASTEKEVLSKLSPDELRAMALGILDGLSKQNSGVEIPVFEGRQMPMNDKEIKDKLINIDVPEITVSGGGMENYSVPKHTQGDGTMKLYGLDKFHYIAD